MKGREWVVRMDRGAWVWREGKGGDVGERFSRQEPREAVRVR
jgi:hypothetical protein